jgi:toxin-antitoxin system PIN domain toxin
VTVLLDANVLIALVVDDHVHHDAAEGWMGSRQPGSFATCPITQGSLVRLLLRLGQSVATARGVLSGLASHPDHEFWPDDVPFTEVRFSGVVGHRQVTDAYLAQVARTRDARLATFDKGLAALQSDVAELVPTA